MIPCDSVQYNFVYQGGLQLNIAIYFFACKMHFYMQNIYTESGVVKYGKDWKKKFMIEKTLYFEDYLIGDSRKTFGRTITEADIVIHAGQTGDFFPHHMDSEWVKTQEFKRRIAHGTLILSIAVGMTATDINPVAFSYGYDRVRFIKPVFIGDTITVTATITEKRDYAKRPDRGYVVEHIEVVNQENTVVLACQHLYLVERKTASN